MSDTMLHTCPACDYALYGLPERGTCPECGFDYDKQHQLVWRPPSVGRQRRSMFILGCATLVVGAIGLFLGNPRVASILVVLGALYVIRFRRVSRPTIVFTPTSFIMIACGAPPRSTPFTEVSRRESHAFLKRVRAISHSGQTMAKFPAEMFDVRPDSPGSLPAWNEQLRRCHAAQSTDMAGFS